MSCKSNSRTGFAYSKRCWHTCTRSKRFSLRQMHPIKALLPKAPHVQFCCRPHHFRPLSVHASRTKHQLHLRYWLENKSRSCRHRRVQSGDTRIQSIVGTAMAQAYEPPPAEANPEIVVVTTVGCQFCKRAKDTLKQAGLEYVEVDASNQQELLRTIKETTGRRSVPQVSACSVGLCPACNSYVYRVRSQFPNSARRSFWEAD